MMPSFAEGSKHTRTNSEKISRSQAKSRHLEIHGHLAYFPRIFPILIQMKALSKIFIFF